MDIKQSFKQRDALLIKEGVFPTAAATPTYTATLDLGEITDLAHRNLSLELVLYSPEMTAANMPDGVSMAFVLEFSDDPAFGAGNVITVSVSDWVHAGSANGADDMIKRYRPSTDARQFVRAKCTMTGTGGTLTDKTFTLEIVS